MEWVILGIIGIVALAVVVAVIYGIVYVVCWFRASPIDTVAEVSARFFNDSSVGVGPASNGGVAVTYSPEKFIVEIRLPIAGRPVVKRVEVDEDLFDEVSVGDSVCVRYRRLALLGEVSIDITGRASQRAAAQ